jgi:hypothetical protein
VGGGGCFGRYRTRCRRIRFHGQKITIKEGIYYDYT